MVRLNLGRHARYPAGLPHPLKTFPQAFASVRGNPGLRYKTGGGKVFLAQAKIVVPRKGVYTGQHVRAIVITTPKGTVRAYIYACCWRFRTNHLCTYIDSYAPYI